MAVEWKRKKKFDGETCGLKGCTRKAGGYLYEVNPCTASPAGAGWYGPICFKCCEENRMGEPASLAFIFDKRKTLAAMAKVFNLPEAEMWARMEAAREPQEPEPAEVSDVGQVVKEASAWLADVEDLVGQLQVNTPDDVKMAVAVIQEATQHGKKLMARGFQLQHPWVLKFTHIEETLGEKIAAVQQAAQAAAPEAIAPAPGPPPEAPMDIEVTNPLELPRQYLVPDMKKLRQAIKGGFREIPGTRVFLKESSP